MAKQVTCTWANWGLDYAWDLGSTRPAWVSFWLVPSLVNVGGRWFWLVRGWYFWIQNDSDRAFASLPFIFFLVFLKALLLLPSHPSPLWSVPLVFIKWGWERGCRWQLWWEGTAWEISYKAKNLDWKDVVRRPCHASGRRRGKGMRMGTGSRRSLAR